MSSPDPFYLRDKDQLQESLRQVFESVRETPVNGAVELRSTAVAEEHRGNLVPVRFSVHFYDKKPVRVAVETLGLHSLIPVCATSNPELFYEELAMRLLCDTANLCSDPDLAEIQVRYRDVRFDEEDFERIDEREQTMRRIEQETEYFQRLSLLT